MNLNFIYGTPMTAAGVVKAAPGILRGLIINSHTSGVIKIWDNASAASGTALSSGNVTLAAGPQFVNLGDVYMKNGIYLNVVSGTVDITPVYL
jgi:hypothetical protein